MKPLNSGDDIPQWIHKLDPRSAVLEEFAAKNRKTSRRTPPIKVPHAEILYRQWDGPIGPWSEHFGKGRGQVYPLDGGPPKRSCNEIEVAKLLRKTRSRAVWVSCYRPEKIPQIWQPWAIGPQELPPWLAELDSSIRRKFPSLRGGIPDVVAWNPSNPLDNALFVECKGPGEAIKDNQEDWVAGAIQAGVSKSRFAVAIRVFR